jgi:hypothetical protein
VIVGKSCAVCSNSAKSNRKKQPRKKKPVKKSWEQDEIYDGLDLPDDDFDYDKFVEDEFGNSDQAPHRKIGIAWYWWVTALILSVIWIFFFV